MPTKEGAGLTPRIWENDSEKNGNRWAGKKNKLQGKGNFVACKTAEKSSEN